LRLYYSHPAPQIASTLLWYMKKHPLSIIHDWMQ
jgi:hypothetical protein